MSVSKCLSFLRVFHRKAAGTKMERYICKDAYYIVVGDGGKTGNNVNVHQGEAISIQG